MLKSWQDKLVRQALASLTAEELVQLLDTYLPELTARWSKEERMHLLEQLLTRHLRTLLADLTAEEKQRLLKALLPTLLQVFPLDDLDMLALFR